MLMCQVVSVSRHFWDSIFLCQPVLVSTCYCVNLVQHQSTTEASWSYISLLVIWPAHLSIQFYVAKLLCQLCVNPLVYHPAWVNLLLYKSAPMCTDFYVTLLLLHPHLCQPYCESTCLKVSMVPCQLTSVSTWFKWLCQSTCAENCFYINLCLC